MCVDNMFELFAVAVAHDDHVHILRIASRLSCNVLLRISPCRAQGKQKEGPCCRLVHEAEKFATICLAHRL